MPDTPRTSRSTLPELLIQAVMVVFAVVVALAVEEWREEREMHEFADRARAAVVAEVRANLQEFQSTGPDLERMSALLGDVVREQDINMLAGNLSLTMPEFSSAAWRTAQTSRAAQYLDYDWVIRVSRAYEVYDYYLTVSNRVIDSMSEIIGREPTVEKVDAIYGRLLILVGIHGQVEARLEALVEQEG